VKVKADASFGKFCQLLHRGSRRTVIDKVIIIMLMI